MKLKEDIQQIIDSTVHIIKSINSLPRPICEDSDINKIEKLNRERSNQLELFFKTYSLDEFSTEVKILEEFTAIDKQLLENASSLKQHMSNQILNQKKNVKATKAYKSIK